MGAPAFISEKMAQIFYLLLLLPETKIKQKEALFQENLNLKRTKGLSMFVYALLDRVSLKPDCLSCSPQIDQMQLGLPSRDYFLHLESEKDLEAYHQYMTDVATLLGANRTDAEDQLWKIVEFEQVLANVSTSS